MSKPSPPTCSCRLLAFPADVLLSPWPSFRCSHLVCPLPMTRNCSSLGTLPTLTAQSYYTITPTTVHPPLTHQQPFRSPHTCLQQLQALIHPKFHYTTPVPTHAAHHSPTPSRVRKMARTLVSMLVSTHVQQLRAPIHRTTLIPRSTHQQQPPGLPSQCAPPPLALFSYCLCHFVHPMLVTPTCSSSKSSSTTLPLPPPDLLFQRASLPVASFLSKPTALATHCS